MKRIVKLITSVFLPGVAHILLGRIRLGVVIFLAEVVLVDALALVVFRPGPDAAEWKSGVLLGAIGLVWLVCQAHMVYLLYLADPEKHAEQRETAFREGLRYYVQNKLNKAVRRFEMVLRFDPFDRDAWFYLGVCHSRAGARRRAARSFKKCIEYDDSRKWAYEVSEELRRLKARPRHKADRTAG